MTTSLKLVRGGAGRQVGVNQYRIVGVHVHVRRKHACMDVYLSVSASISAFLYACVFPPTKSLNVVCVCVSASVSVCLCVLMFVRVWQLGSRPVTGRSQGQLKCPGANQGKEYFISPLIHCIHKIHSHTYTQQMT